MSRRTTVLKPAPSPAPVYGLLLAGGASRRMQTDKAELEYHGKPQIEWLAEMLAPLCDRVFVSVRVGSDRDPPVGVEPIVDDPDYVGPAAGILSAQRAFPNVAWLVVACDLPFLDAPTLEHLLSMRDPARAATAYRSVNDGLPEPLCALWEPASQAPLRSFLDEGFRCPRKFLINAPVKLIEQPRPGALDNVNTPDELEAARRSLGAGAATGSAVKARENQ